MKLYYRLGVAADRELLQRYAHLLDGFVINAHIGAWSGGWLPVFLQQLEKPYYIDPYTSIYSHNIEGTLNPSGDPKASFLKLADRLPRHIRTALDEVSPIQPTSLLD